VLRHGGLYARRFPDTAAHARPAYDSIDSISMMNPKILLAILVAIVLIGVTLLAFQWWITGGIITVIGGVLMFLWWRMNQLLDISQALANQDLPLARTKLDAVKNPEKLNPYSKTYYYYFLGMLETYSNNFKPARQAFKVALETNRFRAVDEKASVLVMMAQLDLRTRNNEGAKRFLREAKALEPSQQVKEQINSIVKQARLRL
jgi:hypothetical protein